MTFFCSSERRPSALHHHAGDLLFELGHAVDRFTQAIEQAALHVLGEFETADGLGEADALTSDPPLAADPLGVLLRGFLVLRLEGEVAVEGGLDVADELQGLALLALELLFGDLFLDEDDQFLDPDAGGFELFAGGEDFPRGHGRARDLGEHDALAALDALRDRDLALAGEEGNRAHLAQVHADGIVGLVQRPRGEVDGLAFFGVGLLAELLLGVDDLDAHRAEHGEDVFELVGRVDVRGEHLVDFFVEKVALLLAHRDAGADFVVLLFECEGHFCVLSAPLLQEPCIFACPAGFRQ